MTWKRNSALLLLARTGKSVRLTAAGRIFFGEARDVLARTLPRRWKKPAQRPRRRRRKSTSATFPSGTVGMLSRVSADVFKKRFPEMRVILHDLSPPRTCNRFCSREKLDVGFDGAAGQACRPPSPLQELARYETCVAVGATHPLAKSKFVRLDQMASEPVATYTRKDYPGYNEHLKKLFATVGCKPQVGSEHDSGSSLITAVAAGHEFAILPSCVRGVAGSRLKFLKLRPALPPWSIVALWRQHDETELVKAFLAALPGERKSARKIRQASARKSAGDARR